jgi:predicted dehydrogenase
VIQRGADESPEAMPVPGVAGFAMEDVAWEDHDSLAAEHAAFAASILDGAPVLVDASVGRRALAAALEVGRAMRESRERMAASGLITVAQS